MFITMDHLRIAQANYKLTDLLKEVSDENLRYLLNRIITNDIEGDIVNIYSAVLTEIQYRNNSTLSNVKFK